MLLLCFCNEYVSLQMKEIYKISILEDIVPTRRNIWTIKNLKEIAINKFFDFVKISLFVTLFTGVNAEPLYFLKITKKRISDGTFTDTWGHVVLPGLRYFKKKCFKPVCSRNIYFKKFDVLPMSLIITPDEVYDTYVEIMLLDVKIYNLRCKINPL